MACRCTQPTQVLLNCSALPLRSRRLLRSLWRQQGDVALEALGRVEREESTRRARDELTSRRVWAEARGLLEDQLVLRAR